MIRAVVGCTWGDEGKGKITDLFAGNADIVVRFQGGSNAGHTIINDKGKFVLHLLPSGVFHEHVVNVIGPGVALDPGKARKELDDLKSAGIKDPKLIISNRAQIVMPWHILFDRLEEERLSDKSFGSTKSGIAPFYADKYLKIGIQTCDLFYPDILRHKIKANCEIKNVSLVNLYGIEPLDADTIYSESMAYSDFIKPYLADTTEYLANAIKSGKRILLEGQLGALKDPDHGIYPMTTSSSTLAGFGAVGAGVPPYEIKSVTAVMKAYSTCVGAGEFVTEIFGDEASELRTRGGDKGEFGATTGRPRRVGWFDGVACRYGCLLQGATEVALTNIDVLGCLDKIPVCTEYNIGGKLTKSFPVTPLLSEAKPVYTVLHGWKCDIRGIRDIEKLPIEAIDYIRFVENLVEKPIKYISTGPAREDIIIRT